jgi:NAD(P)H dehydrogenase (quinone)
MRRKAVLDADEFPPRVDLCRLSFIMESAHAYSTGRQSADVAAEQAEQAEQAERLAADAAILQFQLWWRSPRVIFERWIERIYVFGFAYGYKTGGSNYRFGPSRSEPSRRTGARV